MIIISFVISCEAKHDEQAQKRCMDNCISTKDACESACSTTYIEGSQLFINCVDQCDTECGKCLDNCEWESTDFYLTGQK